MKRGTLAPPPQPLPLQPPPLPGDTVTRTLPEPIQQVVLGGGGRFLILRLAKVRQLAVFDVNEGKVVRFLPVAADNVLVAAGMSKLVLVYPDTKVVQRWDLLTGEREQTATLPISDPVSGIGMGYGSDGPLLLQTVREPITGDDFLCDIRSLQLIDLEVRPVGHVHRGANALMRGSSDGRTFGVISGSEHAYVLTVAPGSAVLRGSDRMVIPGPTGKYLFGFCLAHADLKPVEAGDSRTFNVPALQGPFYLAIPAGAGDPNVGRIELRLVGDQRPLLTLPELDTPMGDAAPNQVVLTLDQRFHFIPDAHLLVSIPRTADRLVLHRLDLDAALAKSGIDYLFVTSTPPGCAVRGQEYTYPIRVKARKGGLKYRMDAGPAGMKVDADGTVRWAVPANHDGTPADVILTISDSTGQEVFHTFRVEVVEQKK